MPATVLRYAVLLLFAALLLAPVRALAGAGRCSPSSARAPTGSSSMWRT